MKSITESNTAGVLSLEGKHIILGITGSIAAYKAAVLCRLLKTAGAEVRVVMTHAAKAFITPLTMATLSKNPIAVEFYNPENGDWNSHISLGEWADLLLIAPATANTLAKMATGVADNLLLTTYLSARCGVAVAPAMDCDMFAHTATQHNLDILRSRGVTVIESPEGELASGLHGKGRMAEPEDIAARVETLLCADEKKKSLQGKCFVVTAGATREAIDPVRFLTNRSTGKMGYAIAAELVARGARTILISGCTSLAVPQGAECRLTESAEEMYRAAVEAFAEADGAVMCAAVADYTPEEFSPVKIKKGEGDMVLKLKRTHDIAAELGKVKGERILAGFALETDNETVNAEKKLRTKNLDFIVLNSLRDAGAGFGHDTNKISIIDTQSRQDLPLMSKREAAEAIADKIEQLIL